MSLPFLNSFTGFPSTNGSATKFSLPHTDQFKNTLLYLSDLLHTHTCFSCSHDQHLDLSLMFPGPGILRQSGTVSEPSGLSLPPSGMSSRERYLQGRVSAFGPCMPYFQSTPWWVPLPSGQCAYPSMHTRLNLFSAQCSGAQGYTITPNLATKRSSGQEENT